MKLKLNLVMAIVTLSLMNMSISSVVLAVGGQNDNGGIDPTPNVIGSNNNIMYSNFYNISGNNNLVYGDYLNIVGNKNRVTGDHLVVVGNYSIATPQKYPEDFKNWTISLGKAPGEGATLVGDYATVEFEHGTALGYGAKAYGKSSVALGAFSKAVTLHPVEDKYAGVDNARGIVSIGAVDNGLGYYYSNDNGFVKPEKYNTFTRQLQGVAAGEISETSTDAINGSQLHATIRAIESLSVNNGTLINTKIDAINNKIDSLEADAQSRDTMNAVLSALKPLSYDPREPHQFMAGVGAYKNKRAVALGYAHYFNESTLTHIGLAHSNGNSVMINGGVSVKFGRGTNSNILPQYEKGPISSIYVFQEENQALRQRVDEQEQRIARLEVLMLNRK